ncbi:unnamed protein product [Linum trigynum]|uniref:Uncharacterized protein n=1 Tax=Linum trigynum TaxID=586398 RepID=A0AAV2E7A6_9ROSI
MYSNSSEGVTSISGINPLDQEDPDLKKRYKAKMIEKKPLLDFPTVRQTIQQEEDLYMEFVPLLKRAVDNIASSFTITDELNFRPITKSQGDNQLGSVEERGCSERKELEKRK